MQMALFVLVQQLQQDWWGGIAHREKKKETEHWGNFLASSMYCLDYVICANLIGYTILRIVVIVDSKQLFSDFLIFHVLQGLLKCGCSCTHTFFRKTVLHPQKSIKTSAVNILEFHRKMMKLDFLHPQLSISYANPGLWKNVSTLAL